MKTIIINVILTAVTVALFGGPLFIWVYNHGI